MRDDELTLALTERGGVLRVADAPHLRQRLQRGVRAGRLRRPLRGVYVWADAPRPQSDVAAVLAADPDAVLAGRTAAALSFATDLTATEVTAYRSRWIAPQPGFRWWDGPPPPELIVWRGSTRITSPALTVLDLIDDVGGDIVDRALRDGVTLGAMWHALTLTPDRPGNASRRKMLHDSRDEPWSEAERLGHTLLRDAGLTGWQTNVAVGTVEDHQALGDVVWRRERLIVEFDGWEHHGERSAFEADRWRDAVLTADGWTVLRFTWLQLTERPTEVIELVRGALAAAEHRRR